MRLWYFVFFIVTKLHIHAQIPKLDTNPISEHFLSCNPEYFEKLGIVKDTIIWFDYINRNVYFTDLEFHRLDSIFVAKENYKIAPELPQMARLWNSYLLLNHGSNLYFYDLKTKKLFYRLTSQNLRWATLSTTEKLTVTDHRSNVYEIVQLNDKMIARKLFEMNLLDKNYLNQFLNPEIYLSYINSKRIFQSYASSPQISVYDSSGKLTFVFANPYSGFTTNIRTNNSGLNACFTYSYGPIFQYSDSIYSQFILKPLDYSPSLLENENYEKQQDRKAMLIFYDLNLNCIGELALEKNHWLVNKQYVASLDKEKSGYRIKRYKLK